MDHDDGNSLEDIEKSDIILLGVSRTSKTPTAIYLANRGFKTSNIPMINENSVPEFLKKNPEKKCVIGLTLEPTRLTEVRKNRMSSLKENHSIDYTNQEKVELEIQNARKTFKKYQWPIVDVTRKSVEETAASIIKIYEIKRENG
jgi:regulator of PEP synthase PpsR (kinase-PPPase family)